MKKIIVLVLFILLFLSFNLPVHAYWNKFSNIESATVLIGQWDYIGEWNSTITYLVGNKVTYNGITYIALKTNIGKIPGARNTKTIWRVV